MTHRETKKESKRTDNKSRKAEIIKDDEIKKQPIKGIQ
jgi:hypothetical protein